MRSFQTAICGILTAFLTNLSVINTAYAVEFLSATTISASNTSYEGQDLIVNNSVLTIDGSHQFNSVQLLNGAVLTHSVSPAVKLVISSNTFLIDASSRIDLTGKGHLPNAEVRSASGGSYGGLGGVYEADGSTNPIFGEPTEPTDLGIGGIGSAGKTHGGGAIHLITDQLTLQGRIIADGEGFNTFFSSQGGGSGGSILLDIGQFDGSGTLEASGGSGFTFYGGGGGGGGRIAVYYASSDFDLNNNIINLGGVCKPLFGENGQAGSIYLEQTNTENQIPTVSAGADFAVEEQSAVTLNGSASDADGVIVSYRWTQISGANVTLINADTAIANFDAPMVLSANSPAVLQFRLSVIDDQGDSASDETHIAVFAVNALPTANAGDDFSVDEATEVNLNGSAEDSDGDITAYHWQQISGTAVTLSNNTSATARFTAPTLIAIEQLAFQFTVTDNESGTHSDTLLITVTPTNTLPVARITVASSIAENTFITLDGSASSDADGDVVGYQWTQLSGVSVTLLNPTQMNAGFISPSVYQETSLSFRLNILDNEGGVASSTAQLLVFDVNPDDDNDGLPDLWEIQFFDTLSHDGSADTDNDGASDLDEYNFATDPTVEQQPAQPNIVSPDNIEVTVLQTELVLINPNQHSGFSVNYEFEIYSDTAMTTQVASTTAANLSWTIDVALSDNTQYYWRARAASSSLFSGWVNSQFFVNTANDAPADFNINQPQDGVWVSSFTPTLSVTNSSDVDGDSLTYQFEIYLEGVLIATSNAVLSGEDGITSWTLESPLLENNIYLWRAIVSDEHGLSKQSETASFFVNTINDAPQTPILNFPDNASEITDLYTNLITNNASDPEGEAVYYLFELDTVNTFDSGNTQISNSLNETANTTSWSVAELLDNTWYFWRAKASDGGAESSWANAKFFVNQFNDAPETPKILNPGDHAWTGSLLPTLEVYPVIDIDGDSLSYEFNIYQTNSSDELELIATAISDTTFWQLDTALAESGMYSWQARAIDEHGLASAWSDLVSFFADDDEINDAPEIQIVNSNKNNNVPISSIEIKWHDYDPDSNAQISLYYDSDAYAENGTLIVQGIAEDPDGDFDRYFWDITQVSAGIYFIYAIIDDGNSSHLAYSNYAVVVGDGGGQPFLSFKTSSTENQGRRNQRAIIAWRDLDSNSNASISLYYDNDNSGFDGTLIADNIEENRDGNNDLFLWDTSTQAEGDYYIYAIISDATNSYRVYSNQIITIHHGQGQL